jgi:SAM-dependent methyltransferase
MAGTGAAGIGVEDYDIAHTAVHGSALLRRLWSVAMGDQYPAEVEPYSACTWGLLGQLVATLRLPPNRRLADLGCGRGGPGLWLARALSADLVGIDFSPVAVELADARARHFVGPDRTEFRLAPLDRTGLPDASVDAAVSIDAMPFAPDRTEALREARRILVPGGRLALTLRIGPGRGDWPSMARSVGLDIEHSLVNQEHDEFWRRLHTSWLAHESELRSEVGDRAADNLVAEAQMALQRPTDLPPHRLLVLRRPADRRAGRG